jgi:hypothetical protein
MPLYIKIDFRRDARLGAWWARDSWDSWNGDKLPPTVLTTTIEETRVRDVLIAVADAIDPLDEPPVSKAEPQEGERQ